ncbi:hypothetical protein D5R81_01010 [Parashewanella spongiae]|uniref:Uncharacterized protein n=1 Tax=Parashewanella spongiae TaxID=342950 RepID=A0A3A6U1X6_9GAMM|nr:hypothetical protein [Parashewanella spongiae]MCL1078397.1 hypothetical protein [Parashewanella spongiae]RJY19428.1 hypothetical protein D5R81_01010 [Parashewanella spongiae]
MFSLGLGLEKTTHSTYYIGAHADNYFAGETETYTVKGLPSTCKNSKGEVIAAKSFQRFWCPATRDITRSVKVVDMRQVPLEQWLINRREARDFPLYELRDQLKQLYLEKVKINFSNLTSEQQTLINACFKLETFLPTFAEVARELYEQLNPIVRQALRLKHSECSNETFNLNRICQRPITQITQLPSECAPDIQIAIAKQDKCHLPNFNEWTAHIKIEKGKLLDRLLVKMLKKVGFLNANPQIFVGFVNPILADPKAKRELFMDDSCSSHPLHGQRTHLFQILALTKVGVLNQRLLEWLIDYNFWNGVLDTDRRMLPLITIQNLGKKEVVYYRDIGHVTTGIAPGNLNILFLERKFSASIQAVIDSKDTLKQTEMLNVFGRASKMNEPSVELTQLHKEMVSLEAYIIDSLYSGFHKMGIEGLHFLYGIEIERIIDVERARKYISKGYSVTVSKSIWPAGPHPEEFYVDGKPVWGIVFNGVDTFDAWYSKLEDKKLCFIVDKKLSP